MRRQCRSQQHGALSFMGIKGSMVLGREGFAILPDMKIDPVNALAQALGGYPVCSPQPAPEPKSTFWCEKAEDKVRDRKEMYGVHAKNFRDCLKLQKPPASEFNNRHWVSIERPMANSSARTDREGMWDSTTNAIHGDKEASAMLQRPYRGPWDAELKAVLA